MREKEIISYKKEVNYGNININKNMKILKTNKKYSNMKDIKKSERSITYKY